MGKRFKEERHIGWEKGLRGKAYRMGKRLKRKGI